MRPEDVDLSKGERIAFASSEADGRDRWTELAVYHFTQPPVARRPWLSVAIGRTVVEGERDKERRLLVGSLERALKLFDEGSDLGVIVCEEAREWAEGQEQAQADAVGKSVLGSFDSDHEALRYLYAVPDGGALPSVNSMAADLGIGESSLRMSLKNGTGVKVPLRHIAALIDPALFRARREASRGA